MNKLSSIGLAVSLAFAFSSHASAAIVSANATISGAGCTGPSVSQAVPGSVGTAATNNDCTVNVFGESKYAALTSTIQNDPVNLTLGSGISTASGSSLASGTLVSSYLINFQPSSLLGRTAIGSVTFSEQILAVVYSNLGFNTSNYGFTNTSYLQGSPTYTYGQIFGLETALADSFTISGNTLSFNMYSTSLLGGDNLRVITAVPAPASIALLSVGAVGLLAAARRKKSQD